MTNDVDYKSTATRTVVILCVCLVLLILLLIFLYKKLNRENNGEYTVRRMVYKEGGVRDRVRGVMLGLGTRLGVQLWPQSETDEDGEEMQDYQDEEAQVKEGGSQDSDSEDEQEEEEEDGAEAKGKESDTSNDHSSLGSSEAGERARLTDQAEAKGETEVKVGGGEGKGEASGGPGLLIDLKQFSGSAIWSEENGGEGKEIDMTAL